MFHLLQKILKKVQKLLGDRLSSLGQDVYDDEENLKEFKKMMWEDSTSFDDAEIQQVMAATAHEAEKALQKQAYFKKLCQIKNKPYFASIVFKDDENKIHNIYISLTYLKDDDLNNILYDWRSPVCSLFYDYETVRTMKAFFFAFISLKMTSSTASVYLLLAINAFFLSISECMI